MSAEPPPAPAPLDADQAAWMQGRVSIIVGSRDAAFRPHLMRALGCRVSPDHRQVTLLMGAHSSRPVLDDLRDNGQVAVVFTQPSSNRALQLKGTDATIGDSDGADRQLADRYLRGFIDEISQIGFPAPVAHTILAHQDDLVTVRFTIGAAFEQTPGPQAGQALTPAG